MTKTTERPGAPEIPKESDAQDGSAIGDIASVIAWFFLPWLVGVLMFIAVAVLP